ncbi:hypothetical protein [Archaeoglobus profundus]|uniref:Uncharacterized protein n=1 Tax=Archaeoglobus profundus (strain DSM 5631 / JCM 9629 / NBRC 100127 / Av18) TaxID=572546 RepID=D2RGX6_ARCPA|nr:hypothetical protein [Archaeoglobus profundus]ADB57551.1 hypothetical protein Arcpr_0485 [Archaeoglobus profundus DSM 5631]
MLFRKKKKAEDLGERVSPTEDVDVLREKYGVDIEDDILRRLEELSFAVAVGAKDRDVREKALNIYGKVKLVRSIRGTEKEEIIKLYAGLDVPDEFIEKLKEEGLAEVTYKVSGVEIKAKNKEELAKKLEDFLQEEIELKDDVKIALSGKPLKVDESNAEVAGKLYELGAFEIYLVPKGWFDLPYINGVSVERNLKELNELKEALPEYVSKFLES